LLLGLDDVLPARGSAGLPAVEASIRVAICPDLETEAVLAAREILRHVRAGGRYRDCAVLLRTLDDYHDVLRRVFWRYEIPFFLDRREPVAYHPLAELTRYALRTVTFGWEHDDWFGALKTGLVPVAEEDIDLLENEALARGWSGDAWQRPLRMAGEGDLENRLERVRTHIIPPFQQLAKQLAGDPGCAPTGSQLAAALRDFWHQLNVNQTLEGWSVVASNQLPHRTPPPALHSTVLEQMQSWLGNLDLAFSDESLPLRDWLPILEAGLANLTVGVVPAALDQVLIGALDRSRNPELELAIVLGLNESVFPAAPALISVLSETDREQLEARGVALGPDKRAQLSQERYYGYVAFTRARRRLVLTCAARNLKDRPMNRSPFLAHLKRLFPALEFENYSPSRDWLDSEHVSELVAPLLRAEAPGSAARIPSLAAVASWPALASLREPLASLASYSPADSLSPALAGQLYGPVLRTSVSALEHFAACPFRYFVRAGMRAEERKLFEADVREQGSFQHAVLAAFHNQLRAEGKEWRDITPEEARERVRTVAAGLIAEFRDGLFEASDQNVFAARSLTAVLQDFIETLVGWMAEYGFDPRAVELSFGQDGDPLPAWEIDLGSGHRMALRGKMDRVDLAADPGGDGAMCVVVDYKSNAKKIDPLLLENGIQIQLPAYLAALRHFPDPHAGLGVARLIPAGFFYVGLRGNYPAAKSRSEVLRDIVAARRLAHRHAGRFSLAALPLLDRSQPADPSGQFNYALTRNGEPNRRQADPLEPDEFTALLDRLENQLREMGRRIFAGDATVDPYRKGSETACDECDFRAICRIDPWTHSFRVLKKLGQP
jgi:ATP-dependent helicase/nuclease subunit B